MVLGSNDIDRSKRFYDVVMGVLGVAPPELNFRGALVYRHKGAALMITRPLDGNAATAANGNTVAITLDSPDQVHAWQEAGVAAGGTAIEDPPGLRSYPSGQVYSAYLRDPDGHKLCGICPIEP
ncbi:VOC family protein [Sphingobium nicotianae]|uniref:VOC family protein n=1 Tax=Sphingobium nicotianae TaxID=2782607 RepID=UPI0032D8DED2